MFKYTVDDKTSLTTVELRDTEELFALTDASRNYLREWLPWLDGVTSPENTCAFIQSALDQQAQNNGFQCCIHFEGKIAGVIGFHRIDWNNRKTEIGYWLAPQFQGRGIMTNCCRALVEHAFSKLALNRVEIHVAMGNTKSRAIPERLGFTNEGVRREAEWLYDHYVDLVVYAMLRKEWRVKSGLSKKS
jgi:ribosomal-protein-serine acetyltransferase